MATIVTPNKVSIVMGSSSDKPIAEKAEKMLEMLRIPFETRVLSAHRDPDGLRDYVKGSDSGIFIAIAGMSAALGGAIASHTLRPVIGVPVSGKVPLDSLLSMVQMPKGVPVAVVAVDTGENAALLAAQMIALGDPEMLKTLELLRVEARKPKT